MRTSNKTIMMVLGVGAVLALAGQALAQGSFSRGRDGFRGGSDSRSPLVNRGYTGGYAESGRHFVPPRIVDSPRGFRGGFESRSPFVNRGFTGGYTRGYAESPRYFAAPRIVESPRVVYRWWLGYSTPVYVAPPCGLTGRVFVAPQCSARRPVFVAPFFPQHRYEQPTWRYYRR